MKKSQDDYIKYRLDRAWNIFEDAKSLANLKSWNSSMNRLYYACFYAVLALFTKNKMIVTLIPELKHNYLFILLKQGNWILIPECWMGTYLI